MDPYNSLNYLIQSQHVSLEFTECDPARVEEINLALLGLRGDGIVVREHGPEEFEEVVLETA